MKRFAPSIMLALLLASALYLRAQSPIDSLRPPAIAGKCFAKSITPDKYQVTTQQQLVTPAQFTEKYIPAEYDTLEQTLQITPAYYRMVPYPAEFDTIMVNVRVKDDSRVIEERYAVVREVKKVPSGTNGNEEGGQWMEVTIPGCESPNPDDCKTLRWVSATDEYNVTDKQTFVRGTWADTVERGTIVQVPKVIQVKPPRVERVYVPAEYRTIKKAVLRRHARKIITETPAVYQEVRTKQLVEKGGERVWVEIICPEAMSEIVISQVQLALKSREYYDGNISGRFDASTIRALEAFQRDEELPIGKLDKDTIKALGFNFTVFSKPSE